MQPLVQLTEMQMVVKLVRGSQDAIISKGVIMSGQVPIHAATYKLARLACSRHDAEPVANGGPSEQE